MKKASLKGTETKPETDKAKKVYRFVYLVYKGLGIILCSGKYSQFYLGISHNLDLCVVYCV